MAVSDGYFPAMRFLQVRWSSWLWLLLIANAGCLLFFRCFITLDGPIHVLHAAVLKDALGERLLTAHGLRYTLSGIDIGLLDPIAMLLLNVLSAQAVEVALGVIVLLMFSLGALAYVRAYGNDAPLLVMWVLPFAFSFLLLLGLFPFVFAMGLCMWLAAHWVKLPRLTWRAMLWSLGAMVLCLVTHRSAVLMLLLLTGVHEMMLAMVERDTFRKRWSFLPRQAARAMIVVMAIGGMLLSFFFLYYRPASEPAGDRSPFSDLLHLRSLLLFDGRAEPPLLMAMAVLMLGSVILAMHGIQNRSAVRTQRAPLIAALALLTASLLVRTQWAYLHYFAERAQLFGLLLLMLWCAVHVKITGSSVALAFGILSLHTLRTVYIERRMAHYADERRFGHEVLAHLKPNTIVAPAYCEDDWLLQHQFAGLATEHKGIVLTKRDKVWFERDGAAAEALRHAIKGKPERWRWLLRCADDSLCPPMDYIVVLGYAGDSCVRAMPPLPEVLGKSYVKVFANAYAILWERNN